MEQKEIKVEKVSWQETSKEQKKQVLSGASGITRCRAEYSVVNSY